MPTFFHYGFPGCGGGEYIDYFWSQETGFLRLFSDGFACYEDFTMYNELNTLYQTTKKIKSRQGIGP